MEVKVFIHGMDKIIKRDLEKHKALLASSKESLSTFTRARLQEIKRKKHYQNQIGNGKYNNDAMRESIKMMNVNIKQFSDSIDQANGQIKHHTLIVDTLQKQLDEYNENLTRRAIGLTD